MDKKKSEDVNSGNKVKDFSHRLEGIAGSLQKFVETNFIDKEQREENLNRLVETVERWGAGTPMGKSPSSVVVGVKVLEHFSGELPSYESEGASGFDIRACLDKPVVLAPGERRLVPTGLSFEIPNAYEIQVRPRSGWAIKEGVTLLNTPGTIDADYRGEVKIIVINLGSDPVTIQNKDRIAQMVLCPVIQCHLEEVTQLSETERGEGGFGSTGKS